MYSFTKLLLLAVAVTDGQTDVLKLMVAFGRSENNYRRGKHSCSLNYWIMGTLNYWIMGTFNYWTMNTFNY